MILPFSPAALSKVSSLLCLSELNLSNAYSVNDEALIHLKNLSEIKSLNLYHTAVTGTGLAYLYQPSNIKTLILGTNITEQGLQHIQSLE